MAAGRYDFTIEQGATFARPFQYQDGGGAAVDLTGWRLRMDIREERSKDSALVLDTGSSRFKGGKSVIQRFLDAVTDDGRLPISVSDPRELNEYPDIILELGGQAYVLTPADYFLHVASSRWEVGIHHLEGLPDEMLLVGSVFLDTVYSVFVVSPENGTGQGVILARPTRRK